MAKKKRKVPQINGASSADIAFMLLLFFLLTTSMDTDQGLARTLPRPPEKEKQEDVKFNKRNVLQVMINSNNQILCAGEVVTLPVLKDKAKEFIDNPTNSESLPEKTIVDIPYFGEQLITESHLISLQCDRGTNYQVYIDVQNELARAYNELREVISKKQFGGKSFSALSDDERSAVTKYYPQRISEAEPKKYGDKKK